MGRSSNAVKAERINMAQELLLKNESIADVIETLVQRFGISKRQAYRYLREAQSHERPIPIPERKIPFTVKLPQMLVEALHERAYERDQKLSELVTQALEAFLYPQGGGSG